MPMTPDQQAFYNAVIEGFDRLAYKMYQAIGRMFGGLAGKGEEPYWYVVNGTASSGTGAVGGGDGYVNLQNTVNAINSGSFRVTQEADFVATRMVVTNLATATGAVLPEDTTGTIASYTVQIRDGGSDRVMANNPFHVQGAFGNGRRNYPLPKNKLFRRNSTVTFSFSNLQTTATQIWAAVLGYKIYSRESLNLTEKR